MAINAFLQATPQLAEEKDLLMPRSLINRPCNQKPFRMNGQLTIQNLLRAIARTKAYRRSHCLECTVAAKMKLAIKVDFGQLRMSINQSRDWFATEANYDRRRSVIDKQSLVNFSINSEPFYSSA
jgi:hypothetical protein